MRIWDGAQGDSCIFGSLKLRHEHSRSNVVKRERDLLITRDQGRRGWVWSRGPLRPPGPGSSPRWGSMPPGCSAPALWGRGEGRGGEVCAGHSHRDRYLMSRVSQARHVGESKKWGWVWMIWVWWVKVWMWRTRRQNNSHLPFAAHGMQPMHVAHAAAARLPATVVTRWRALWELPCWSGVCVSFLFLFKCFSLIFYRAALVIHAAWMIQAGSERH